jgi:hypothetical protein
VTDLPKHSVSFLRQTEDRTVAIGEPMIPLILSQSATTTAQTPPVPAVGAASADVLTFDEMMAATAPAGADIQGDAAEGAMDVAVAADPELPPDDAVALPAVTKDVAAKAETPIALPVPAAKADSEGVAALSGPVADGTQKLRREGPNVPPPTREGATEKRPDQTAPVAREGKSTSATVAQSVVEGRLPVKARAEVSPTQPPQPKPAETTSVGAPPPASPPSISDKPRAEIVGQAKDVRKPSFHPADEQPRPVRKDARPPRATVQPPASAGAHVPAAQPPAVALAQIAAHPQREMVEKASKPADLDNILSAIPAERHTAVTGTPASGAAAATPETARHVAAQIAVAVTNSNGKTTEIALNPEELGRVKLSLAAGDGVITVNVLADRPETQDLLRRHIDILAQEFRQLGYTSISFSFGDQKGQARPEARPDEQPAEQQIQDTVPITQATPSPAVGGLDLRI